MSYLLLVSCCVSALVLYLALPLLRDGEEASTAVTRDKVGDSRSATTPALETGHTAAQFAVAVSVTTNRLGDEGSAPGAGESFSHSGALTLPIAYDAPQTAKRPA